MTLFVLLTNYIKIKKDGSTGDEQVLKNTNGWFFTHDTLKKRAKM